MVIEKIQRCLFIIDALDDIHPSGDTSVALMNEAQKRSLNPHICHLEDIYAIGKQVYFLAKPISLSEKNSWPKNWCQVGEAKKLRAEDFNFVFMRKDPPVDNAYLYATCILDLVDQNQTKLLNSPSGLRVANEKLFTHHFAEFMPKTVISSSLAVLKQEAAKMDKVVLKPIHGRGGFGVMVFEKGDSNFTVAAELLTQDGQVPILLQEYIKEASQGDKRIILLGGNPVGALLRVPAKGEHRANLHVGGTGHASEITADEIKLCQKLKPQLLKWGLHFVGIDVIGGLLTEINVTSPTGIVEIDDLDRSSNKPTLAKLTLDYIESL